MNITGTDKTVAMVIEENPGIRFNEIKRITGLQNGTISYVLRKLYSKSLIVVRKFENTVCYFPHGLDEYEKLVLRFMRQLTPSKIIMTLIDNGHLTTSELSRCIGKSMGTTSLYKNNLFHHNIIEKVIDDKIYYVVKNEDKVISLLNEYFPEKLDNMPCIKPDEILECYLQELVI